MPVAKKIRDNEQDDLSAEREPIKTMEPQPLTTILSALFEIVRDRMGMFFAWAKRFRSDVGEAEGPQPESSLSSDSAVVESEERQLSVANKLPQKISALGRAVVLARASLDTSINKRQASRLAVVIVALMILVPIVTWVRYQSLHVISTNAIIRGHVTEIGTQLEGIVTAVEVDAGDRVYAGQVLALLDDRRLLAEAREARAVLEMLNRQLAIEYLEISHARRQIDQQLVEATANLSAAQAESVAAAVRAENAQLSYQVRKDLLAGGGAISGEVVRESDANRRTTQAMMRASDAQRVAAASARANTRLSVDALVIRERKVGVLEAEIARAEALVSKAETALDSATIRAPQGGSIVRRILQVGGSVDVGQPIISMRLGNEVWVEAWIDEEDIAGVKRGSKAAVSLNSFPDREFVGTVDKLGLTTDFEMPESEVPQPRFSRMRSTPVVGVRIVLDDPPLELLPGLSAVVSISRSVD